MPKFTSLQLEEFENELKSQLASENLLLHRIAGTSEDYVKYKIETANHNRFVDYSVNANLIDLVNELSYMILNNVDGVDFRGNIFSITRS